MSELKAAQKFHWEDLVQAMKPQLDAMQQDLNNKGSCFARLTDKGIQFIPYEDVYVKEKDNGLGKTRGS